MVDIPHFVPHIIIIPQQLTLILLIAVIMSILHVGLAISKLPMYCVKGRIETHNAQIQVGILRKCHQNTQREAVHAVTCC